MQRVVASQHRLNGRHQGRQTTRGRRYGLAAGVVSLFSVLCVVAPASAADWPTYRQNMHRTGSTPDALAFPLKASWVYISPDEPHRAWSGPMRRTIEGNALRERVNYDDALNVSVVGKRAYFGSSVDHALHCLDTATGEELWSFITGGPIRLAPTIADGRVYFGSDDGYAYCLNASDGSLVWKLRAAPDEEWLLARGEMVSRWPVRTNILVDDGVAYFGAGIFPHEDVFLYAVNAEDGSIIWKQDNISSGDAGRDDLSPQGYLLANDEILYVTSGRSLPAAVDRKTGRRLFKTTLSWRREGVVGGTKGILADGQLYAPGEHVMVALDQKTGRTGFGWFKAREMAIAGDAAYVITGEMLARLDRLKYADASRQRHKLELELYDLSRKVRSGGPKVDQYKKRIREIGEELRRLAEVGVVWKRPSKAESQIIATANAVVVGGDGEVAAYDAETGEELFQAAVEGQARGLVVADGGLFVSTTTGRIYRFADSTRTEKSGIVGITKPDFTPFPEDKQSALFAQAAKEILEASGVKRGYCLVVDNEDGRLAVELARQSDLRIYAIDPDQRKVDTCRRILSRAGLYGHRITVHHADVASIPYSHYFANLIVSEKALRSGQLPAHPDRIALHLKPVGGVVVLGRPSGFAQGGVDTAEALAWLKRMQLDGQSEITTKGTWALLRRGFLPGAANWTHEYGDTGNTASTNDRRVHGGLGVLWYGDPGPGKMVNRHQGAVGPLAVNGRLFIQGESTVMAYDAYNGLFLWERPLPGLNRIRVHRNFNTGNLAADDDSLFLMLPDVVQRLDAETGELRATYKLPPEKSTKEYQWGYLAYRDGRLYGTATLRKDLEEQLRRRGKSTEGYRDAIFALDVASGRPLWVYEGKHIEDGTVAVGPEGVYFIDSSISRAQREAILQQDKSELKKLTGEEAKRAEERIKRLDVRLAVALDAQTGEQLWSRPVDVTDCSEVGIGGGKLTLLYANNVLVLCGANANGHFWPQFLAGEFKQRRLVALSAADGHTLWAKDANYRHRPIIIEETLIAEPWAFDLYTGVQQTRKHPLTGEEVPWSIMRTGHHCGMLTGCPGMLMFRSGSTGFYDLQADSGVRHFAGHRLGCWINAIPANGLVMIPEASAGCVCLFSIASTIVLEPREPRRPWTIYSSVGENRPVRHLALNLAAPGDRKDARGTIWLTYPRPRPYRETGLEVKIPLTPKFASGGRFQSVSERSHPIEGADPAWLYTSWADKLSSLKLSLRGEDDKPARYVVRLHFAEIDPDVKPGDRVFDVRIQGKTVLEDFDVVAAAGGPRRAVIREFTDVEVPRELLIEFVPSESSAASGRLPLLNALELRQIEPKVAEK